MGSSPMRGNGNSEVVAEWLMQRIVNPCSGNGGSSPLNLKKFTGHSIIGNAFDLGLKDYRFKSCCPEKKRLSRIMVVWGSAKS